VSVLADEPGWTIVGAAAIYQPITGGWLARVVRTVVSGRTYYRHHIAVTAPDGIARYTTATNGIGQARLVAEQQVRARKRHVRALTRRPLGRGAEGSLRRKALPAMRCWATRRAHSLRRWSRRRHHGIIEATSARWIPPRRPPVG
jgi:hypothetical protein